jgi:ELWxxDGT repeat protein
VDHKWHKCRDVRAVRRRASLTRVGNSNKVLFVATDNSDHTTLWVTDGTGTGTSELAVPNSEAFSRGIGGLTAFGSKVLFGAADQDFNTNLWVTDGTAAGTSELSVPGAASDLEADTVSSLMLTGGASIVDSAGNAVSGTLPVASKNLHLTIDSIRPSVTSVTHTPLSGTVNSGGSATITLKMSQPVAVSGAGPVLHLNDGGSAPMSAAAAPPR